MSYFSGVVDFDTSNWAADAPVDTLISRVIFNNLEHLADQSAQVLVNSPCTTTGNGIVRSTDAAHFTTLKTWGPLSIRVRDDGASYRIRWRARMRLQSAGSVEIYFVYHPPSTTPEDYTVTGSTQNWDQYTLTSTSIGWITPDNDVPLYMTADMVGECLRRRSTPREIGGDLMDVSSHEAMFSVVMSDATAVNVEINGFYAAEYIGV